MPRGYLVGASLSLPVPAARGPAAGAAGGGIRESQGSASEGAVEWSGGAQVTLLGDETCRGKIIPLGCRDCDPHLPLNLGAADFRAAARDGS